MFGREPERAQIEQVLDAGTARPAGIVLEGDPGIGKTTLLREALAGAAGRSFQTLVASPSEPEAGLSFAGLGDLISGVVDGLLDALPGPQRHAVSAALSLEDASQAPADPLALLRGILTILSELSAQGPLLVAIDDEQWVDQASGQVLAFALGRLRAAPICLLMTRRPESGGALWRELARSFGGHGLEHLAVTPLDLPAIEALLKEQLKMTIPRSLVRRVHHTCGGNPLFALAIARELKPQHVADHEVPLPRTLSDAMHERLRDVAPVASDALLAVASVSRATLALLRAALPQFTADELDTALDADVIEIRGEQVRFTHPLLASTHYARTPPSRRRRLHRALAQVVVDEEERARHLALGASGPDSDVALTLEDAAGAAALRGAPAAAALLLEDAVLLTPSTDADAQRVRRIAAAEQHWAAGNADRARSLLEDVVPELTPGPLRARAFDALSLVRNDDWRVSEALLEQALWDLSGHDRDRSRVESHLVGLLVNRAKFIAMLTHARSAVESAERAGDDGALAEALAGLATAEFFNGRRVNRAALGRAIELEETDVTSTYNLPSTTQGFILFWGDEHAAAREVLEQSAVRAADRGEEYDRVAIVFHLAILEWRVGNWESAMRHHADVASMLGQGEVSNDMWVILGESLFALGRGELDLARERARDALAIGDRIGDVMIAALPAMVLAEIDLRSGKPSAAHERIAPIRERLVENGFGFLGSLTLALWSVDVEALIATDQLELAGRVVDDLTGRAARVGNPHAQAIAHRCRGLLLAAGGDLPGAIDAMAGALVAHGQRPLPPEIGRTLVEKGALERRAKQKSAAKQTLEAALELLTLPGARLWAARAQDELSRIGLRRAVPSQGLTPAQTRVAEMVVGGMSNREIAGSLYMSERTVEAHLTRIYREFGVRSRTQLVTVWPAAGLSSDQVVGDRAPGDSPSATPADRP